MEKLALGAVVIILVLLYLKSKQKPAAKKITQLYYDGKPMVHDTNVNNIVSTL